MAGCLIDNIAKNEFPDKFIRSKSKSIIHNLNLSATFIIHNTAPADLDFWATKTPYLSLLVSMSFFRLSLFALALFYFRFYGY